MSTQRVFMFTIIVLLLSSCAKKETDMLQLISPPPGGIVPRDAPFILTFSRPVVAAESTNQWTSTPYIEFNPELPGKFTWRDTSTLVFSADGPLPGDSRFTARLNTGLLTSMAHVKSFSGPEEFVFATQSFTMTKAEFFYDRVGQTRTVGIKANLFFTYGVDPAEVIKHIKVVIDHE